MGVTVIGPPTGEFPYVVASPVIELRRSWADDWEYEPELELVRASGAVGGQDLGSCELKRRYGRGKQPYEGAMSTRESWDLNGWWVRMNLPTEQGIFCEWVGRIGDESRDIQGIIAVGEETYRSGAQHWVAFSPLQILRKVPISRSYWLVDDEEVALDWVPDVNGRDDRNMLVGNRSATKSNGTYLFGGTDLWTREQYLEYIIKRFVEQTEGDGPEWRMGGQVDLLAGISDTIPSGLTQTADQVLARLIPRQLGIDYKIAHDDQGFSIEVYAISAEEWSFGGATLPRNPNTVRIEVSDAIDILSARVERSQDQRYRKIRVIGARLLVCCSLRGNVEEDKATLVPKWSASLEEAYKEGTGNAEDTPADHDAVRQGDEFRAVYRQYGAPDDWDHNDGLAAPVLDALGGTVSKKSGDYQNQVRNTLSFLPLQEGVDYGTIPATNKNPDGHQPDFLPPAAWVYEPAAYGSIARYVLAEEKEIGVSASRTDWGVFLHATPNHLLALNRWSGARPSETDPLFDYDKLVATIALRTDQRLVLEAELPGADPSDGVLEIAVPDAEMWLLAPNTVVGIQGYGSLKLSGYVWRILRDDGARMRLVMAGAIGRYQNERARAEIVFKGLLPWSDMLGQVLTFVEQGGDLERVQTPITSIEWQADGKPTTTIRTGFA